MIDNIKLNQDSRNLCMTLKNLYQTEFPPNYKLIAEYVEDKISNPSMPGERLTDFIRILSEIDIPAFFVLIKTNCPNIESNLEHLSNVYNYESPKVLRVPGDFVSIEDKKDTFCILPWVHFYFNAQGQINPCCNADTNYPLGQFGDGIDFNSKKIVDFRKTLLDRQTAPQCTSCYNKEKNNLISPRKLANIHFRRHMPENPNPVVDNFKLRYLDVRLNNVCNLKCRMCSGKFSSKIADEDYKIWGSTDFLKNSNSTDQEENLLDLITSQIDNIEHVYFAGGEPLVDSTHYKILDLLLAYNKHNIKIQYNTNFSMLKYKKHNVLDYWKKFNNVIVGASIDLVGAASNYVRNGVEYQVLENNYFDLIKECPRVNFTITSVLSLYNIFNLCDLQKHWIDKIKLDSNKISFQILTDPNHLSIRVLPNEIKRAASEYVLTHINYLKSVGANALIGTWQSALTYMNSQDDSYLLNNFFELGDIRDKHRGQHFEDYFPEFRELRKLVRLQIPA